MKGQTSCARSSGAMPVQGGMEVPSWEKDQAQIKIEV